MKHKELHNWKGLRARFIGGEWNRWSEMHRALLKDFKEGKGPKPPSESMISLRATREKWLEDRIQIDARAREEATQQIIKKEAAALVEHYEKTRDLGNFLTTLGAKWLDKNREAITTVYEALAAVRAGTMITGQALEGIADLKGIVRKPVQPKGEIIGGPQSGDEEYSPKESSEEIRASIDSKLARLALGPKAPEVPPKPDAGGTGTPAV